MAGWHRSEQTGFFLVLASLHQIEENGCKEYPKRSGLFVFGVGSKLEGSDAREEIRTVRVGPAWLTNKHFLNLAASWEEDVCAARSQHRVAVGMHFVQIGPLEGFALIRVHSRILVHQVLFNLDAGVNLVP